MAFLLWSGSTDGSSLFPLSADAPVTVFPKAVGAHRTLLT